MWWRSIAEVPTYSAMGDLTDVDDICIFQGMYKYYMFFAARSPSHFPL